MNSGLSPLRRGSFHFNDPCVLGRRPSTLTVRAVISIVRPRRMIAALLLWISGMSNPAQIPPATDAPRPLSPKESLERVQLPDGYRLELIASEPLIREPSGVCWDERGRLFVSELHGYNLEGQYDIEELNRTGQLDREVRRVQASERAKQAALAESYGTVKLLADTNGDGVMDKATVFADRLPPAYGICPARGGIIVACAPDIVFLADRDGDGQAEVREVLFTGFATGALERGINQPQWGLDDWVYFGRGHGGGRITGPRLAKPVQLPNTDFRIKADGSAIEPITGGTHTFGHAFAADGDRFTTTTSLPGRFVTPLPWHYLARNPDAAAPASEQNAADYTRVFPVAPPHPWRTKRAEDPDFFKFYRDRYGAGDSDAGGWFTSGCGALVYQDIALPAECHGAYFVCEPAQNLVHRAVIERHGTALRLRRADGEEAREFLASGDPWFHPIHLAHAPDGSIAIVDMYREIIEDYSAVPRYLQQQYGLTNGINHGRLWRLTHRDAPSAPAADMSRMPAAMLAPEAVSPHFWRRQTARRLLVEQEAREISPVLSRLAQAATDTAKVLNALYTLEGLGTMRVEDALAALKSGQPAVRRHGLRFSERWLDSQPALLELVLALSNDPDPAVQLQLALTLGETRDSRALNALVALARAHGGVQWMPYAILTSLHERGGWMLDRLLESPASLGEGKPLLDPLCAAIAARRNETEMALALALVAGTSEPAKQVPCLRGFQKGFRGAKALKLGPDGYAALATLMASAEAEVRRLSSELDGVFQAADPAVRRARLAEATRQIGDLRLPPEVRLAAVAQLASSTDTHVNGPLLSAWAVNTPKVQEAILDAMFARRDRLPTLLDALESRMVEPRTLSAFQRVTLLEHDDDTVRQRAAKLLTITGGANDEVFQRYSLALAAPRDRAHGERVFREHCATCHKLNDIGFAVGPDLSAEFLRAEEAILRDILAPNDTLTAGYATYVIETTLGETFSGILASESATSITLRMPVGLEQVVLRKDVARLHRLEVSLMPEGLIENLEPGDVADVIAFVRGRGGDALGPSPGRVVLFDEEREFLAQLREGEGTATFETNGAFSGTGFLAVTPPQRYSPRIDGWNFRITERPVAGEFRYLRLAWKAGQAKGVMIELAADGRWPEADSESRRYYAGTNTTKWQAREVSPEAPQDWRVVKLDLWKDCGAFTLTGIAPTAMGGPVGFDRIELLNNLAEMGAASRKP
ncbi:MAG: c-type cytochrome [Verrucomicrobia bacterium]|nr:c-type cytochrome [Verrucomicrobiota bacterium]